MIQFNLLPDVKLEFMRVRRNRRLVIGGSLLLIAVCLFVIVGFVTTVFLVQRTALRDLDGDIARYTKQLKDTPELDKVLTVQNQLKALPDLHNGKPAATRMYEYIRQVTPSTASISQLDVDFEQNKMTVTGNARSLDVVNVFADTLKFTTYKPVGQDTSEQGKSAFTATVLSQFSRNTAGATYTITTDFDPAIFDIRGDVRLQVPKIISTRSATEQPKALFQTDSEAGAGGN